MKWKMWCTRLCFVYLLLSSSVVLLVSSAPSDKRSKDVKESTKPSEPKLKQLLQAEPPLTGNGNSEDSQWYPTIDMSNDVNDFDYPSETAAAAKQKGKPKTVSNEKKSQDDKSSFKTFCEDGSKNPDCARSTSKSKKLKLGGKTKKTQHKKIETDSVEKSHQDSSENRHTQDTDKKHSLNGIIGTNKEKVDKQDHVERDEVKKLREYVAVLAKEVDELQRNCGKNDPKSSKLGENVSGDNERTDKINLSSSHGTIAEIEEKHKIERLKSSKQDETVRGDIDKTDKINLPSPHDSSIAEIDEKHKIERLKSSKLGESVSGSADKISLPSPRGPIAEIEEKHIIERKIVKGKNHQENKNIVSKVETIVEKTAQREQTTRAPSSDRKYIVKSTTYRPPEPPRQEETGFRKTVITHHGHDVINDPADVNFNGGINLPMDKLKEKYPDGYWPDDVIDNDSDSDMSETIDKQSIDTDSVYYDEDDEGSDDNEEEKNEYQEYEYDTTDPLSPEYLEKIIKKERELPEWNSNQISSLHHVQEHKLPARKKRH